MSYKAFNAKNKKAKKGISPVIATVILVAVAVVIAAALAGFSSSLFGTYSSAGGAVTVESISVHEDGAFDVTLHNSGNVSDEMLSIQVVPNPTVNTFALSQAIAPGASVTYNDDGTNTLGTFDVGQPVNVKMTFKSGVQLTQSTIVVA